MIERDKRWLVAGAVAAVVVAVGTFVALRPAPSRRMADAAGDGETDATRWRGFQAGAPRMPGADPEANSGPGGGGFPGPAFPADPATSPDVGTAMTAWRTAISTRDSDTVLTLDRVFAEDPARFGPALVGIAQTDGDERVRAFSTRVLGKLKDARRADLFARLLGDRSAYVRQNAAWALGELGTQPVGREAAQRATAELRRLAHNDAAPDVRTAAGGALKRLQ